MASINTTQSPRSETPVLRQRYFAGVNDILMRYALAMIIFFWSSVGLMILMDLIHWKPLALPFLLFLSLVITSLLSRSMWRRHAISEEKERRFSMLVGAYWGYLLTLIYVMIFPYKIAYCIGLMVALPLIGICVGKKFPMYGVPTLWKRLLCGLVLWFLALPPLWGLSMVLPFTSALNYQGEHLPSGLSTFFCHDYALMTRDTIPRNATDIYIKGKGGRSDRTYHWSCRISEADFLAFAKENNYHLFENDDKKDVSKDDVRWMSKFATFQGPLPDRYWGAFDYGVVFLYDCTTGIFHGYYKSSLFF